MRADAASPFAGRYVDREHGCETVHLGLGAGGTWSRDALRKQVGALVRGVDTGDVMARGGEGDHGRSTARRGGRARFEDEEQTGG